MWERSLREASTLRGQLLSLMLWSKEKIIISHHRGQSRLDRRIKGRRSMKQWRHMSSMERFHMKLAGESTTKPSITSSQMCKKRGSQSPLSAILTTRRNPTLSTTYRLSIMRSIIKGKTMAIPRWTTWRKDSQLSSIFRKSRNTRYHAIWKS